VYIDGTKTPRSKRTMPLFNPLYELQDYLKKFSDNDHVFTASDDALNDELRRILTAIGIAEPMDYSLWQRFISSIFPPQNHFNARKASIF